MANLYNVKLTKLVEVFHLKPVFQATDYEKICITVDDVSRPGMQLTGFFDYFEPVRLQVLGAVEMGYLRKLSSQERLIIFEHFLSYKIPALIITRNMEPLPECLEMARKHNISVLSCAETTSNFTSALIAYLNGCLAPRVTRHGVLMDVYGEGIFITGDSGIGKSETAVELLKRGHRLIADDAVEIRRISSAKLMGSAPELIRNYIELRGIGIINVANLFGMAAIKEETVINLVINIVHWNDHVVYDRLGLKAQYVDILGVNVPSVTVPVTPGRNLAVIMEVAAMNNRQKRLGYNAAIEFTNQLNKHFEAAMQG